MLSLNYIFQLESSVAFTSFSSVLKSWKNLNVRLVAEPRKAQLHTKNPQPRMLTVFLAQVSPTLSIYSLDLHWNALSMLVSLLPLFGLMGEGRNEHINVVRALVRIWTVVQRQSRIFFLGVHIRFRDNSRFLKYPPTVEMHKYAGA
jgi:hypothetical protein